jgi:hypothetical protein
MDERKKTTIAQLAVSSAVDSRSNILTSVYLHLIGQ